MGVTEMSVVKERCDFCFRQGRDEEEYKKKLIYQEEDYQLIASLGAFIEGYVLYAPKEHHRSFATLGKQALGTVKCRIKDIRKVIEQLYNKEVVIAEHGPGLFRSSANSVDHAHLHLIPVRNIAQVLGDYYEVGGIPHKLESFTKLSHYAYKPYIYLSYQGDKHFVWTNTDLFPRQFVRRTVAANYGIGDVFDWKEYPFVDQMHITAKQLRKEFANIGLTI